MAFSFLSSPLCSIAFIRDIAFSLTPLPMPVHPDDPRLARCGFAKLFGDGGRLDYIVRKYEVTLGRPSKGKAVDVPLADHKAVSREHAHIRYNFDTSEESL